MMESSSSEELSQSLSGSQYDAQNASDEWTILSDNDDMDDQHMDVDGEHDSDDDNRRPLAATAPEDKTTTEEIDNECNHKNELQVNGNPVESLDEQQMPDTTSDIDVIDEDDLDSSDDELSTASLCSSSVVSQTSNLSFLRDQYLRQQLLSPDFATEDLSESSSLNYRELGSEVELKRGTRAYVHTPNTGLNGKLNLILILSVSTVVGLGIGNFIGWSNHWNKHKQLSLGQVLKLKQLQDELVVCMQDQANKGTDQSITNGQSPHVCYTDNDYFRGKFETLFSENKGLLDALQRTQQHYHSDGDLKNIIADKECDNKSASEEFHKLKLGFLVNQMEHLHLLKTLEEVKYKGQQSEKRVKDLEVENSELKMKLVEEEEDDEVIVQSWGSRVALLEAENQELKIRFEEDEEEDEEVMQRLNDRIVELLAENQELKAAIYQLEAQVVNVVHTPSDIDSSAKSYSYAEDKSTTAGAANLKVPVKLDLLKQRINQMVIENDELKSTIARLRWTSHDTIETEDSDQVIDEYIADEEVEEMDNIQESSEELERQLNELRDRLNTEQMEAKKWREMYENLKTTADDNINQNQDNKPQKPSSDKMDDTIDDEDIIEDNVIYDWVLNSTNLFREALHKGSSVVSHKLKGLYDRLMSDNESIIPLEVFNGLNLTQTVIIDLNRRLQNKWQELQDLKTVFASGNEKISNKMSRLYAQTIRKLHDAKNKLLSKEKTMRSKVDEFTVHMSRLVNKMDDKWNQLLNKLSKRYSKDSSTGPEDQHSSRDTKGDEEFEPKINWFFRRANSRRKQHVYGPGFGSTTRTARTVEFDRKVRVNAYSRHVTLDEDSDADESSDREEAVDSGVDSDAEHEEDVNWFLKRPKKSKLGTDYEFERPTARQRRMKYRSNGRYESSTSHRFHQHSRQR